MKGKQLEAELAAERRKSRAVKAAERRKARMPSHTHRCKWVDDGQGGIKCKRCGRRLRLVSLDEIETGIVCPPPPP